MAYFVAFFTCVVAAVVASTAAFFAAFFLELSTLPTAAPALFPAFAAFAVAVVAFVFAAFAQHLAFATFAFAVSETALQQVFATAVPALQHSLFTLVSTVCALALVPKHTIAAIRAAAVIILFIVFTFLFVALSGVFRPLKYRLCNKRQAVVGLIKHNIPRPSLRSCACRLRKNRRFLNPTLLYYTRLH